VPPPPTSIADPSALVGRARDLALLAVEPHLEPAFAVLAKDVPKCLLGLNTVASIPPNFVDRQGRLSWEFDLRLWRLVPLPLNMRTPTAAALRLRAVLEQQSDNVAQVLSRYDAFNPRLFGSVARGDAREDSDLDLLVDLAPGVGNELLRVSGISEELSTLIGVRVDVVASTLLRGAVSATALADAVAV